MQIGGLGRTVPFSSLSLATLLLAKIIFIGLVA